MLNGFTNVTITKDLTKEIASSLKDLAKKTVCIGIPDSTEHADSKITNAQLLYVHTNGVRDKDMIKEMQHDLIDMPYSKAHELYVQEHGSPLWKVPPRPVLEPAMEYKQNQEQMVELMKDTINVALDGKDVSPALNEVGLQGQNIARDWFTNSANEWEENKDSTIKKKGSDRPLIDSGEMRRAITFVVKDGEF